MVTMDPLVEVTYLVFGQAMPTLDLDVRYTVVELINDGDMDIALDTLVGAIDKQQIKIDDDLLAQARQLQPHLV